MYPIRLPGDRVVLREFRRTDTAAVHEIVGDQRVAGWLSFDTKSYAETEELIRVATAYAAEPRRSEYYLMVTRTDDGEPVGFVRLALAGVAAAKLGYAIGAAHWGNGFATEAAALVVRFGFETLLVHRVSAAIGPENKASIAVATKLGMSYEGRIRHHVLANGQWRDSLLYSILADEWARRVGGAADRTGETRDTLGRVRTEGDWQHGAAG